MAIAWAATLAAAAACGEVASAQCRDGQCGCWGQVWPHAQPSDTGRYVGYYVGGGSPFHGEPPTPSEGVWGWDYAGFHFWPRIELWWNHGQRYQGGPGAYRTDGPRVLQQIKEKNGE
jgi:hypothetical protein